MPPGTFEFLDRYLHSTPHTAHSTLHTVAPCPARCSIIEQTQLPVPRTDSARATAWTLEMRAGASLRRGPESSAWGKWASRPPPPPCCRRPSPWPAFARFALRFPPRFPVCLSLGGCLSVAPSLSLCLPLPASASVSPTPAPSTPPPTHSAAHNGPALAPVL